MRKLFLFIMVILPFLSTPVKAYWVYSPIPDLSITTIYSLTIKGNDIFAAVDAGVYLSYDEGSNWTYRFAQGPVYSLAATNNDVYATMDHYIYYSNNHGITWPYNGYYPAKFICVAATRILGYPQAYAGSENHGVYYYQFNDQTWRHTSLDNRALSMAVNGNVIYAGTQDSGLYRSTNTGYNWTQVIFDRTINSIVMNGNYGFAGTTGHGVYSTQDNGITWGLNSLNDKNIYSLAVKGSNVYAGSDSSFYFSPDNGQNWYEKSEGLTDKITALCVTDNYILAGTKLHNVFRRPLSELVGIQILSTEIPEIYSLSQNYPNPFNPATKINFSLPKQSFVTLRIFDITGREVAKLLNEVKPTGVYSVDFNGADFASGVYFYRIEAADFVDTKRMVLVK